MGAFSQGATACRRKGQARLHDRSSAPMPSLENLRKQAKQLVRWHGERRPSVGGRIRAALPHCRDCSDAELLAMKFTLGLAQEILAREAGFESWAALKSGVDAMPVQERSQTPEPVLVAAFPQLFVSDVRSACAFYAKVLGFETVFVHGEPPFYAQVARGGACLNLRHVDAPPMDDALRRRESLLSAYVKVSGLKSLYGAFGEAGAEFEQALRHQPWGTRDFVVRDPDGNLLCFAE